MRVLVFDMDGTIADLYGVEGWLNDLINRNTRPYDIARPMYNMVELREILLGLKANDWRIVVTTWLAKDSTKEYDNMVRQSKLAWLERYSFPYDEIHIVKYGTTKADCTRRHNTYQILIDDNAQVRKGWHLGATINANENILESLQNLLTL